LEKNRPVKILFRSREKAGEKATKTGIRDAGFTNPHPASRSACGAGVGIHAPSQEFHHISGKLCLHVAVAMA
jgi:hypothetical protein